MGTITSGVGLISGINTGALINALIQADSGPLDQVQAQNQTLTAQETAYQSLSAQLLALQSAMSTLTQASTFNSNTLTSSNPAVTGTATSSATPGTYNFTVSQLASSQQTVTRGFSDDNSTPVGAGALTFEFGNAGLTNDTPLSQLNGGNGVTTGEIRITDKSGNSAIVDLSQATTIGDVVNDINSATGVNVTASLDGDSLELTDNTGLSTGTLSVTNVGSTNTATSLGLTTAASGATLVGSQINNIGANTSLTTLNDGNGVAINGTQPDLAITTANGSSFNVTLAGAQTIGDVINDINSASGGSVTAQVDSAGTGLTLVDNTTGAGQLTVAAANGSQAGADLGILGSGTGQITGTAVIAALGSKLVKDLNGGSGANLGVIAITNRAGTTTDVTLTGDTSVSDVINSINAADTGVTAAIDSTGNGIQLTDTTGATASNLIVADVSGTGAADLNLAGSVDANTIDSGDLHPQYISGSTLLSSLNGGAGVALGDFTLTDSRGVSATVDITSADSTIQDVLNDINSRGLDITAQVNADGNGIELVDTGPGTTAISVTAGASTTAQDLGLSGQASAPGQNLNGSFAKTVNITASDTLTDVVNAINGANIGVTASIINDGSSSDPYRLSLQSTTTGQGGAFLLDSGGLNLGATTLVQAQNAVVFYGSTNAAQSIPITSTTDTLSDMIPGATINLSGTGAASVTIANNTSGVATAVQSLATAFNSVMSTIAQYDTYDSTTNTAGVLFADPTTEGIQSQLIDMVNSVDTQLSGPYNSLASVGITLGANNTLNVDTTQLSAALAANPTAVSNLFTYQQTSTNSVTGAVTTTSAGVGVELDQLLGNITNPNVGTLQDAINGINSQISLNNTSITQYQTQLTNERSVLQAQFNNMEEVLAQLQSQGDALNSLASNVTLAGGTSSSGSSSSGSSDSGSSSSSSSTGSSSSS